MPGNSLLDFDAALARLLALATPLSAEEVPIGSAGGRWLAADVQARLTQPPAALSAMDGYALRFSELPGPFHIAGEAAAGRPLERLLAAGEAARIFTGAHMPEGADTVALQEDAVVEGGRVSFPVDGPPARGAYVRPEGFDFREGRQLARAGERVTPARMGLLAAAGHANLPVHCLPRVALLSTGDELVPPGTMPGRGQIIGANGLMIADMLRNAGAEVIDLGIVADRPEALAAAIRQAKGADLLVTIGGASVGDHDLVKPALETAGASLDFWKVAIRPGKPLLAGRLGAAVVVGLPGNPVSAFVCARLFLVPLVKRLSGDPQPEDRPGEAVTAVPLEANGPRRHFARARLENERVTAFPEQDSSLLSVLAGANALVIRPENGSALPAGTVVPVISL